MRIIAGANKGRTLKTPKWDGLRPTSDKLRETLFNILQARIEGARVLDVFAGTGAVALITENAALCRESERCAIIRDVAPRALKHPLPGGPFDIVVLDPPYDFTDLDEAVRDAAGQRAADGIVILEHALRVTPPQPDGLTLTRTVKSGDSALTFYS